MPHRWGEYLHVSRFSIRDLTGVTGLLSSIATGPLAMRAASSWGELALPGFQGCCAVPDWTPPQCGSLYGLVSLLGSLPIWGGSVIGPQCVQRLTLMPDGAAIGPCITLVGLGKIEALVSTRPWQGCELPLASLQCHTSCRLVCPAQAVHAEARARPLPGSTRCYHACYSSCSPSLPPGRTVPWIPVSQLDPGDKSRQMCAGRASLSGHICQLRGFSWSTPLRRASPWWSAR